MLANPQFSGGCGSNACDKASDQRKRGDGALYLDVSAIADKVLLVRYQDVLYTDCGMMRLESPLVSPQEVRIVDILFGF